MTHFHNKSATAKPTEDPRNVRVWCARELPPSRSTNRLTQVECSRCREAFAAVLRALPGVDDPELVFEEKQP